MSISNQNFKALISHYGFDDFEQEALKEFHSGAKQFLTRQTGGHVSMPEEYFGASGATNYTSEPTGTIMSQVNDIEIRPALEQTFPHSGGAVVKEVKSIFNKVLKEYRQEKKIRLTKADKERLQKEFQLSIDNMFEKIRKVASKTKQLKATQIKRVLKKHK